MSDAKTNVVDENTRLRELADNVTDALRTALALGHFSQAEESEARAAVDEYDAFILSNDSSNTPETDAMALSDSRTDHNWRQLCRKLEREREEAIRARDVALKVAHTYDEAHTKACEGWAQAERERDEARSHIAEGWTVKAEDYDKLRDAASRVLVAIKKLPIGTFSLLESEYNQLMKVTYGGRARNEMQNTGYQAS